MKYFHNGHALLLPFKVLSLFRLPLIHPSFHLFFHLTICLSMHPSFQTYGHIFSVDPSIHSSTWPSTHSISPLFPIANSLFMYPSTVTIYPFSHISSYLSILSSFYLFTYSSIHSSILSRLQLIISHNLSSTHPSTIHPHIQSSICLFFYPSIHPSTLSNIQISIFHPSLLSTCPLFLSSSTHL